MKRKAKQLFCKLYIVYKIIVRKWEFVFFKVQQRDSTKIIKKAYVIT
jgi:hypothetical protein